MDVTLKTWTYVCGQVLMGQGDTCRFLQEVSRVERTCLMALLPAGGDVSATIPVAQGLAPLLRWQASRLPDFF